MDSQPTISKPKKLLDQVDDVIKTLHYSPRTGETYKHWIKQFILFHNKRHPNEMREPEIVAFLAHLAQDEHLASSTQTQALSSVLFLYRHVLKIKLAEIEIPRAKKAEHVPVVLSRAEVQHILAQMTGVTRLMTQLLYGGGLRLNECLQLRVKDIDFDYRQIVVRDPKGAHDRFTILPAGVVDPLKEHLARLGLG